MKMNFRRDDIKKNNKLKFLVVVVLSALLLYFTGNFVFTKGFNLFSYVTFPLWSLERALMDGLSLIGAVFETKSSLFEKNGDLKNEISKLKIQLRTLDYLVLENKDLKRQLGLSVFANASSTKSVRKKNIAVLGTVLSGPSVPVYDSLVIDRGTEHGVSLGDKVIYGPNIALGEVVEIYNNSSKVRLYSSYGQEIAVVFNVVDETIHTVAKGRGGGNFSIDLPSSLDVKNNSLIFLPSRDVVVLGEIKDIETDLSTATKHLFLRTPVNIKNIRTVLIVKDYDDEGRK